MVIDLSSKLQDRPLAQRLYQAAAPLVEHGLGLHYFDDLYCRTREAYRQHPAHPSAGAWFQSTHEQMQGHYQVHVPEGFQFPTGPLIVVANHPFGLLDPITLGDYVTRHRDDVRIMTNFMLGEMQEMQPWIIPVDPFSGEHSARRNLRPLKDALRHLKSGGTLAIFPSGEVAHYQPGLGVVESPWTSHIGSLVRHSQATVLPIYFEGENSLLFQAAGLLHPMLRTGLLLHELRQKSRQKVQLHVGRPIPFSRLKRFESDEQLVSYLRLSTLVLGQPQDQEDSNVPHAPLPVVISSKSKPTTSDLGVDILLPTLPHQSPVHEWQREIDALENDNRLLISQGKFQVYYASASEIPLLLQEIGRLREITFRQVGEGTGKEIDLDRFDQEYLHLFLWDAEMKRIAGAYRVGRCDQLLQRHGKHGLYTNTLFKFQKPFLDSLDDALEMGRSFIVGEYQRLGATLPLLWRGISVMVSKHPQYRQLFGPVSISQEYQSLSQKLMVEFLSLTKRHPVLSNLVKPRQPFHHHHHKKFLREFFSATIRDVDEFSALISNLEADGKGIPVLLKHYLRLNGTLLSFNVDKEFSSCLDGLIHVDLTQVTPRLLEKYMGVEACTIYLKYHEDKALRQLRGGSIVTSVA